jgi:RES domain-containing protein
MTLWRVSNHVSLDGTGGLRASGRWHHRGKRIVYCAPNPATALLEILVHAEIDIQDIPVTIRYLEIEAPDSIALESLDISAGAGWQPEKSRRVGDEWLSSKRSACSASRPSSCRPLGTFSLIRRIRKALTSG